MNNSALTGRVNLHKTNIQIVKYKQQRVFPKYFTIITEDGSMLMDFFPKQGLL